MYSSEYRHWHTESNISCKTMSPSAVLNSPVKFSYPKGDCPVSAYKLLMHHTKTSGAHVYGVFPSFKTMMRKVTEICVKKTLNLRRQNKSRIYKNERQQADECWNPALLSCMWCTSEVHMIYYEVSYNNRATQRKTHLDKSGIV